MNLQIRKTVFSVWEKNMPPVFKELTVQLKIENIQITTKQSKKTT